MAARPTPRVGKRTWSGLNQSNDGSCGEWMLKWMEAPAAGGEGAKIQVETKCQSDPSDPRWRGDNLICLWRPAINKQRLVKLPKGRSCFTACTEERQLLQVKIKLLLRGLQKSQDTTEFVFWDLIHGFEYLDLAMLCLLMLKLIRVS